MRLLLPDARDDVDLLGLYDVDRPTPADPSRPWVTLDMVTSVDGATHAAGRSAGLSSPADKAVFRALRSAADCILVAAGTARTEGYGPARPSDTDRAHRMGRGRGPVPPIVVVSRSAELDPASPMLRDAEVDARTVVAVPQDAPPDRVDVLRPVADVVECGYGSVDLTALLRTLHARGMRHVVCEGGPLLNASLLEADLVDEICCTVSPLCVGGPSARICGTAGIDAPLQLRLAHLAEADGALFPRWVRDAD